MRKREKNQTRPDHRRSFGQPQRKTFAEKVVDSPYWPALFAAIDAEARGDVKAALRVIDQTRHELEGERFWHPQRVERLEQMELLGVLMPRWAHSRWIVAQAMQGTHARNKWRMAKAMKVAIDVGGGPDSERDREDERIEILDRDWVYRQAFLYELGGLEAFLRHNAAGDLIAGADRIWEWTRSPMRGLRLLRREVRELVWEDPETGEHLKTINIGSAVFVDEGDGVIGRIVPIEGSSMFETAPLQVPQEVAYAVADEPDRWIDALRDARAPERASKKIWVRRGLRDYGLLTDIPYALVNLAMDAGLHAFHHPDDDGLDELFTHPDDYPACLAAWLVQPGTIKALGAGIPPEGLAALGSFTDLVPEPAAGLIRDLTSRHRSAA